MPRLNTAGRNVNMDRIDSWSEVALGICSTCIVTLVLICSCFALFELGVIPWVHSWEGPYALLGNTTTIITTTSTTPTSKTTSSPEITMTWFKEQFKMHATRGFSSIPNKGDKDNRISVKGFTEMMNSFTPPLSPEKEAWAFKFFDCNGDGEIAKSEYDAALEASEFYDGTVECPTKTVASSTTRLTQLVTTKTTEAITTMTTMTTTMPKLPMGELEAIWSKINRDHLKIVRQDCDKMDLEGTQKKPDVKDRTAGIELDEFVAYLQIKAHLDPKEANNLFRVIDLDDDSELSLEECKLRFKKLEKMIEGLGSANTVVSDLDMDGNRVLDANEFGHIGDMLYLDDDSAIGAKGTKVWYYRLDTNGVPGISVDELNFTIPPTPVPPPGSAGEVAPAAATTPPSKVFTARAEALTSEELNKYEGVPAMVQGRTELKLEVPLNIQLPADAYIVQVLWHDLFKTSFDQIMDTQLNCISKDVYHGSKAQLTAKGRSKTVETKHLTFSWEVDVPDGGVFQENLVKKASLIRQTLLAHLKQSGIPWLTQAAATMHGRITAEYYGMKALHLPRGNAIGQNFGSEKDDNMDASTPYALARITDRRLSYAEPRLLI